jgi:hypothetical protein
MQPSILTAEEKDTAFVVSAPPPPPEKQIIDF